MAAPTRTQNQREQDLVTLTSLYLQHVPQAEIARRLGLSLHQITYDLNTIRERWRRSVVIDFGAAQNKELAECDTLERAAWEGFRRSQEDSVKNIKAARKVDGLETQEAREERQGQAGDSRFLQIVMSCIDRRCKILGLEAPERKKVEISWREEAQKAGVHDPDSLYEQFVRAAMVTIDGSKGSEGSASPSSNGSHDQ